MKRSCTIAAFATLYIALAASGHAADFGPTDRWLEWENNHAVMAEAMKRCDITPPLATQWDQNLQQLARKIANTQVSWAEGQWGDLRGVLHGPDNNPLPCKTSPLTGDMQLTVWSASALERKAGKPRLQRPGPNGEGSGSAPSVRLYLNERPGTHERDWLKDAAGPRMTTGKPPGTLLGHPLWDEKWLLVTAPGRPQPFVPAPLDRVVKAWVAAQNAQLAEFAATRKAAEDAKDKAAAAMFTKMIEANRPRIEAVRKLLDGPPAQLKGPVYIGAGDEVQLQPSPDTEQVWMDNPAAFDPKLPRSAVQIIAIDVAYRDLDQPAPAGKVDAKGLLRQFIERVDWRALAAEGLKP